MKQKTRHFSGYFFASLAIVFTASVLDIVSELNILPLLLIGMAVLLAGCAKIAIQNSSLKE
jgi:ABC-type multidrug transport system permease subunit